MYTIVIITQQWHTALMECFHYVLTATWAQSGLHTAGVPLQSCTHVYICHMSSAFSTRVQNLLVSGKSQTDESNITTDVWGHQHSLGTHW